MAWEGLTRQPAEQMKKTEVGTDFWDSSLLRNLTKGTEKQQLVWLGDSLGTWEGARKYFRKRKVTSSVYCGQQDEGRRAER